MVAFFGEEPDNVVAALLGRLHPCKYRHGGFCRLRRMSGPTGEEASLRIVKARALNDVDDL